MSKQKTTKDQNLQKIKASVNIKNALRKNEKKLCTLCMDELEPCEIDVYELGRCQYCHVYELMEDRNINRYWDSFDMHY